LVRALHDNAGMQQPSLAEQIARQLEHLGLPVSVTETGDAIVLDGVVPTEESRAAAEDVATSLAPDRRVENNLDVDTTLPTDVDDFASAAPSADLAAGAADLASGFDDDEPDFAQQPLLTDPIAAAGAVDSGRDDDPATEDLETYTPPSDPVIDVDEHGQAQVLGGFESDAMSEVDVDESAEDDRPGDEALADAVRRELREDAATADLRVFVTVRRGVVHLRGQVEGPEDADNAEEVAARVPGVREVVEELDVLSG
jgi:osmotically-inducible protein OsmY